MTRRANCVNVEQLQGEHTVTMHLVGPYLTTSRYNGKTKLNAKQKRALEEHEEWMRKKGIGTKTKTEKRSANPNSIPDYREGSRASVPLSNKLGNGYQTGVMVNLHKESPETQKEILAKAKRLAPAYSKGAYQYITPGSDVVDLGKKR